MTDAEHLVTALRLPGTTAAQLRAGLDLLLAEADPGPGIALALDVLAGGPRIKPSRGLLVDPGDSVRARWGCRVVAAAALLESAAGARVVAELRDELSDSAELAADVRAACAPDPSVAAVAGSPAPWAGPSN
ncbi:hypothetical protein SAMN05443575_3329 [Jatrophihabitans endophyticus]|uniref:Uncharacterized protein n=1 Tax=Jatrophihabitans endophyticus TaxID=1206085 RepID=A0A1M5Q9B7_9ACTN|nr:hypothetical protein [Jatrophihabitans endophyticus]SHH10369.1 hypothetical protein SAMN05443575_3329 [Jatrophihabitans endophyticus]